MRIGYAAVVASLLFSAPSFGAEFTGHVRDVLDGDTIAIIGYDEKVRLADIDAPEITHPGKPGQPYGEESRRALNSMVGGKDVRIEWKTKDRYGRYIGTVYVDSLDVNAAMVRTGHAWVYDRYSSGQREKDLIALQDKAKTPPAVGIWSLPKSQQIKPWEWRDAKKETTDEDQSIAPSTIVGGPECGTKKLCSQMQSCEEAKAFFTQCLGMEKLDGNKDGVPCDEKCR